MKRRMSILALMALVGLQACGGGGGGGGDSAASPPPPAPPSPPPPPPAPQFVQEDDWVTGLSSATAFAQTPDGRLLACEQGGALRVVKNGALLATPAHRFTVDANGERGLIGVALHPDFAHNGQVYVHYTSPAGGAHGRISRLVMPGDASDGSEAVLVELPLLSSATNHNGGALHFGPDGKLYVGIGENADPAQAQDLSRPFGKLLRFNDDGSVPGDNPFFATQGGIARAVWAYGLRNPFTFAFQPDTGRLHINDVGQSSWEEIDVGQRGANYGWPASEGPDGVTATVTAPLASYPHSGGGELVGFCIAGGAFYPASGGSFPAAYAGSYFFADYVSRWVGRLDPAQGWSASKFATLTDGPVDLLVGGDGALYVLLRSGIARIRAE
jgi:glucose/arabinose dehydrogenase